MPACDVHAWRAEALAALAGATQGVLEEKKAHRRPGRLSTGAHQCGVSGILLLTPNRPHTLLVAEHGLPPAQHRLRIPLDLGHPGWVAQHQCPLVLANTDEAVDFRQILKTSHMGSALFGPMVWGGQMLGQVLTAAQARHTYGPIDLDIFMGFAHVAAAVYIAHGGPAWLRTLV